MFGPCATGASLQSPLLIGNSAYLKTGQASDFSVPCLCFDGGGIGDKEQRPRNENLRQERTGDRCWISVTGGGGKGLYPLLNSGGEEGA